MSTSNNLSTWLPQYLHLFNFPPHINPEVLLNLEPDQCTKLEENLYVYYSVSIYSELSNLSFASTDFYTHSVCSNNHNPYGPSRLWSDGDYAYKILDKYHRLDGPAYHIYKKRKYYIENIEYPDELSYQVAVTQYKDLHNLP